jgi:hypothetical protein
MPVVETAAIVPEITSIRPVDAKFAPNSRTLRHFR